MCGLKKVNGVLNFGRLVKIKRMTDWITTDEAVTLSGYNVEYLRRIIRTKKVLAEKKGGHYWVNRAALLTYIEEVKYTDDKRAGPKKKSAK
jgi:hypothetical protein